MDIRGALVEEFERRKSVMIATESGAEGMNLQFCSLVVNYDLPWNPQRIEQRIGRCHRYGQQYDVVVINFINRRNEADRRVFELLDAKLRLFSGVFGASDEVLGALESGVDFEKRINAIYQTCRTAGEINDAFDRLQTELDEQIQTGLRDANAKLMEHFDAEVHDRLRLQRSETDVQIGNFEKWLWRLTQYELADCAEFQPDRYSFTLNRVPDGVVREGIATGNYLLVTHRNGTGMHHYRLGHPLAERIIARARDRRLSVGEVVFTADTRPRVTVVEQLRDRSGWLRLTRFSVTALEQEDHLVFAAVADNGETLPPDVCRKLFSVDGTLGDEVPLPIEMDRRLQTLTETEQNGILGGIGERNRSCFETESEKLDRWADDLKNQLETELRDLDRDIKDAKKDARREADLDKKLAHHKRANALEADRKTKRRSLFDAQDEVERRKDALIGEIEAKLKQTVETEPVFMIHWRVK